MIIKVMNSIGIIFYLTQGYFFCRILSCLMEPKKNKILRLVGWLGATVVNTIVIFSGDWVNVTAAVVAFLTVNCISFKERWIIRVSVIMMLFPINVALNFLEYDITCKMFFAFTSGTPVQNAIFSNLSLLITVTFWFAFWRFTKERLEKIRELLDARSWVLLDIICMASMAAVFTCIYFTPKETYKVYVCMIACIVTNIGSIRLASYLADSIRAELERKNLRLQQDYYKELEKNQLQIRKFRHDMNNHFAVVGELLKEGDHEGALVYFQKLSGHMETYSRQFCKNGIVNALLNVKYNTAAERSDSYR